MAKRTRQAAAAETSATGVQDRPAEETATNTGGEGTEPAAEVVSGRTDLPQVGDIVDYFEREAVVRAASVGAAPWPHAAIVTGIEVFEGEKLLQLCEFHPSVGPTVRRHVRYSAAPEAHCWSWRAVPPLQTVRVPFTELVDAVHMVIQKMHADSELAAAAATNDPGNPSPEGEKLNDATT